MYTTNIEIFVSVEARGTLIVKRQLAISTRTLFFKFNTAIWQCFRYLYQITVK